MSESPSPSAQSKAPWIPPRWFIRTAWLTHRAIYRVSGGRLGLRPTKPGTWGILRLTVRGRRSGQERTVLLGYLEDGANLVTLAMNGWGEAEPAWWLNLQANPDASVDVQGSIRPVRAHEAVGEERTRLWARWREVENELDAQAARRSGVTAVVVLTPRS